MIIKFLDNAFHRIGMICHFLFQGSSQYFADFLNQMRKLVIPLDQIIIIAFVFESHPFGNTLKINMNTFKKVYRKQETLEFVTFNERLKLCTKQVHVQLISFVQS